MAAKQAFTEEELEMDECFGFPKAYAQICRSPNSFNPYINGPPFVFAPYILKPQEFLRAKELNQMFPIIDREANPSIDTTRYVDLLWNQLDHLGNAGFDPELFRVDPYGNVLYLHADSASPLAWEIDHWFPCSRGGKTVPSNLRIVQSQVCARKQGKLDFLIPWWDLQLGISVNQFLSIFSSKNSDFRDRAFSFWFSSGGGEELDALSAIHSHSFPQKFIDMKRKVGLAPAAIVSSQRSSDASVLNPLDHNRSLRHNSPLNAARKIIVEDDGAVDPATQRLKPSIAKENMDGYSFNPHVSITMARDSLRQRGEAKKKQAELTRLEEELNETKQKNEAERVALQELEEVLIKRRRRVETCRRLADAQSSYRALLEKMIRDAMHQSVVYKEQLRLNQAAASALLARLEAQRAICDSSENELRRRFKRRDEIEKQMRPCLEKARKRSRMDDTVFEERHDRNIQLLRTRKPLKKELRELLEEAKKASEAELSLGKKEEHEIEEETAGTVNSKLDKKGIGEVNRSKTPASKKKSLFRRSQKEEREECRTNLVAKDEISLKDKESDIKVWCYNNANEFNRLDLLSQAQQEEDEEDEASTKDKLKVLAIRDWPSSSKADEGQFPWPSSSKAHEGQFPLPSKEDEEEYQDQIGKGNVEKWLKILFENLEEGSPSQPYIQENQSEEIIHRLKLVNPQNDIRPDKQQMEERDSRGNGNAECFDSRSITKSEKNNPIVGLRRSNSNSACKGVGGRKSFEAKGRDEKTNGGTACCESSRGFRSLPSSPSVIFGMRKGVDCIGKKPKVSRDEDDENENSVLPANRFIKTCSKAIKRAMNR